MQSTPKALFLSLDLSFFFSCPQGTLSCVVPGINLRHQLPVKLMGFKDLWKEISLEMGHGIARSNFVHQSLHSGMPSTCAFPESRSGDCGSEAACRSCPPRWASPASSPRRLGLGRPNSSCPRGTASCTPPSSMGASCMVKEELEAA